MLNLEVCMIPIYSNTFTPALHSHIHYIHNIPTFTHAVNSHVHFIHGCTTFPYALHFTRALKSTRALHSHVHYIHTCTSVLCAVS